MVGARLVSILVLFAISLTSADHSVTLKTSDSVELDNEIHVWQPKIWIQDLYNKNLEDEENEDMKVQVSQLLEKLQNVSTESERRQDICRAREREFLQVEIDLQKQIKTTNKEYNLDMASCRARDKESTTKERDMSQKISQLELELQNASRRAAEDKAALDTRVIETENRAKQTETQAREAENRAREAENRAKEAENRAKQTETQAREAENRAREAENRAKEAENRKREAETRANSLQQQVSQLQTQVKNAEGTNKGNVMSKVAELGMVNLGGKYYYFSPDEYSKRRSWHGARSFCISHGLQLASVETAAESSLLTNRANSLVQGPWTYFWIGGTDEGHEGRWTWSGTGSSITFDGWHRGEPNNVGGVENCMRMAPPDDHRYIWWDSPCVDIYRFICEME